MKKLVLILVAVLLVAGLFTGCQLLQTNKSTTKVGVAMPTKSLQRWNQDGENMKKMLEDKGYDADLQYAENDIATQVEQLENMITSGCKVLVIAAVDGGTLGGVLEDAAKEGVKVIAYDRLIMDTENCDYYATFDNYKVGELQGQYIIDTLGLAEGAKGPFNFECFGGSPDDNNAFYFNGGAMDLLQPYIDSGVLVVNSGQTDMEQISIMKWDPATAQDRMQNLLTAYYADQNIDVILSPNDSIAQGIVAALKAAGYGSSDKPYPLLTGQDCDKINVRMMINGEQSMSVFKDTRTLAAQVVDMVDAIMQGTEVPVNDTKTYDNNVKVVPSFLCLPVFGSADNYQELLIDSGYYTEEDIK